MGFLGGVFRVMSSSLLSSLLVIPPAAPLPCYRLTCVVRRPAALFSDFAAGRQMVRCLREMDESGLTKTFCFVVMPDRFHWLFQLQHGPTLAGLACRVRSAASERLPGLRWQRHVDSARYGAHDDLRAVARHWVARPVQLGLVKSVRDYALWDACWIEK